ncbi:hypothetical protein D3C76_1357210 [compost metagenome]
MPGSLLLIMRKRPDVFTISIVSVCGSPALNWKVSSVMPVGCAAKYEEWMRIVSPSNEKSSPSLKASAPLVMRTSVLPFKVIVVETSACADAF